MDIFTQLVLIVGRLTPDGVQMLGTGFLLTNDGKLVTTRHVVGSDDTNLVIIAPHIRNINEYQDLTDDRVRPIESSIEEIHPIRDIAILNSDAQFDGPIPDLGNFDDDEIGDAVHIFGFPHCTEGRRALTYQRAEIGAKVTLGESGVTSKHAVINVQARPGQSGSLIFSERNQRISGMLMGAWAPGGGGGISLGGIDPRELHQTTHCISAEYVEEMI